MNSNTKRIFRTLFILIVLSANIGCDQVSKHIVRQKIVDREIILINAHLILTKVENTGAFLSTGSSLPQPLKMVLLTILPLIVLSLALFYLLTEKRLSIFSMIGICFVVGGGIGNIYDRIMYNSVTDFLHINFGIFETGIFNMADVSVMTGVAIILMESLRNPLFVNPSEKIKQ